MDNNLEITISDNAVLKVVEIMAEEKSTGYLRVFVQGGGCSGLEYGFTIDDIKNEDDYMFKKSLYEQEVKVVIDPISYQYLIGASIDYIDDLHGSKFMIDNPNAVTSCSCGSSFSTI